MEYIKSLSESFSITSTDAPVVNLDQGYSVEFVFYNAIKMLDFYFTDGKINIFFQENNKRSFKFNIISRQNYAFDDSWIKTLKEEIQQKIPSLKEVDVYPNHRNSIVGPFQLKQYTSIAVWVTL